MQCNYLDGVRAQLKRAITTTNNLEATPEHEHAKLLELVQRLRAQLDGCTNNLIKFADNVSAPLVTHKQLTAAAGWPDNFKPVSPDLMFEV